MGGCKEAWGGGDNIVRRCSSSKIGVSSIRKVCQLMERCDGHGGM